LVCITKKRARRPAPFVSTRCNHCRLRWVWGGCGCYGMHVLAWLSL
jgi:hypothetical protein